MSRCLLKFGTWVLIAFLMSLAIGFSAKAVGLKQIDDQARAKFQEARQRYLNNVSSTSFQNIKQAYLQAKAKWQSASADKKDALKGQMQQKGKDFLKNTISSMIRYLEAMKNKTGNVRGISDDDRMAILSSLDTEISWFQAEQGQIDNASVDQLKSISQAVKDRWQNIRVTAKKITGLILAARIKFITEKAEVMASKLQAKINDLKNQGKDTSELEKLLADFNDKIKSAKDKCDQAKATFQSILNKENVNSLIQNGHQSLTDARQYLNQAQKDLVQMARKIKQLEPPSSSKNASSTNATTTP